MICWTRLKNFEGISHKYRFVRLSYYTDLSWGLKAKSTEVIFRCSCGEIKIKDFYGNVLIEEDFYEML